MRKNELKLSNIALIKTIMMLCVVLYHCCMFYTGNWFTVVSPAKTCRIAEIVANWMASFHTQTFTMASGYIFFYLLLEKEKYKDIKQGIKNKVKRLLFPYIIVSLTWVIPISCYFYKYSIREIVKRYVLMTSPSQLWFLIMLFGVFCFFFVVKDKIRFSFFNLVIVFLCTCILNYFALRFSIRVFQLHHIIEYILFFYFGGYLFYNKERIKYRQFIISIMMVFFLFGASIYLNKIDGIIKIINVFISSIISLLEIIIIYVICTLISNRVSLNNKFYKIIEKHSFGIYLFHQQIIYFTIVTFNGIVSPFIQILLSFCISITISLILSYLLEKNKYTKAALGM